MKLHIGCGDKYLSGYVHVDIRKWEHIDYIADAGNLSMIKDGVVDEIYVCHLLEHIEKNKVDMVLSEWIRVLCVGGILRCAVPDFEAIAAEYQENKNLNAVLGLLYGRQNYEYNFHNQAYDMTQLKRLLEKAGFSGIERYNWRDFLPEGYDDYSRAYLPHMDFENGRLMSLNVVAVKGTM
jgi:predicted SAM-dependent methyltransferase